MQFSPSTWAFYHDIISLLLELNISSKFTNLFDSLKLDLLHLRIVFFYDLVFLYVICWNIRVYRLRRAKNVVAVDEFCVR